MYCKNFIFNIIYNSDKIDIKQDEIFISIFLSSSGKIQSFNKIPLNIRKYNIGKEKEELLTLGKCLIDLKYLVEKEIVNKKNSGDNNIGINIINKTNINVNININNYNKDNEIKQILSDIPAQIEDLKNYKEKKPLINLINNDKTSENNNNLKRGVKPEDKPVIIIDNKNYKNTVENKDETFQIIDYIEINNNEELKLNLPKNTYDTFCLGVFISGLASPIQLTSLIESTDNFLAPCGHAECSMFPSIEPDILNSFINKNSKNFQELSHTISNMCFPLGIKPCFGCKFSEKGIANSPDPQKTQQTFFNLIKNEKNECYYLATLQYFIKMTNQEYIMKYRFNPVTYVLDKIKNINNKDKKFRNNMQNISNLLNNTHVLVPESISLISKYPFFISMEKCLRCLISLQKKDDMNNLINHLINEVPSPKKGYQIQFFIPRIEKPLILNHQYNKFLLNNNNINNNKLNNNILSSSQINMKILLEKINIENIIMIFQLLILEQKILFLENDYQTLSEISSVFTELIYPLIWTNPNIPVLSTKTVRFIESPVPFIMGIDQYLLKYAIELKYINPLTEIIIFNIMDNKFISTKSMKRIHKKEIFKEFQLPIMSSKVREYIEKELKDIKKQIKSSKEMDKQIRLVFLKAMIMLIGDYNNFIFYTEDEMPIFNKAAFVESHKDKTSQFFLNEMVKTQIFNQFLLNEKQLHTKINFKLKKISNNINHINNINNAEQQNENNYELNDTSYFKKLISLNQNLLNSEKIRSRAFSSKKIKKNKNKKSSEENEIAANNYILSKNDNKKDNMIIGNNPGDVNHSIDFSKGQNKIDLNQNMDVSSAFSEKNKDENYLKGANNNKKLEKLISRAKSAKRIINLNKKEQEEKETENEINTDEIKIVLLYPYFLNKSKNLNNIDEMTIDNIRNDIEEYSQKNNLKFLIQNSDHVFIRHSYKLNNISQKRIYLYKNVLKENYPKRNSIDINNINNNKNETNKNNKIEEDKNNNEINNNQKEYKLIKDTFIMCFTNKNRISKSDLDIFKQIFLNENNKKYFAKLILPDCKMKHKKNHKLLTSSSFEDISKLLYISLEHLTSNEYNTCRLLTISSFVYYKIENKKLIYLYENYIRGIKPCRLWLFNEFWLNFFNLEFEEELKNKKDSLKLFKYDSNEIMNSIIDHEQHLVQNEEDQVFYETVLFTAEIMIKLKLSKKFILSVFEEKIFVVNGLDKNKSDYLIEQILDLYNKL